MRIWAITAAAAIGFATSAHAGALDFKQVPANVSWLIHVDVDGMRTSAVVESAYHRWMEDRKEVEQHFDKARSDLGMDPRQDLHGLTAFGKKTGKPEGVLIVYADFDQKVLAEKAKLAPDHLMAGYGSYDVHTWTHDKGRKHEHKMAGAFFKPSVLVLGSSADEVKAALDVLNGKAASLPGNSPLAAAIAAGTNVLVRASGLGEAPLPWKSPLTKQCEALSVAIGENEGGVFVQARLAMKSSETAEQIKAIVEGGRAMAALQCTDDSQATKFLQKFKVTGTDKAVQLEFRAPADEVLSMAGKAEKIAKEHHQRHAAQKLGKKEEKKDEKK